MLVVVMAVVAQERIIMEQQEQQVPHQDQVEAAVKVVVGTILAVLAEQVLQEHFI
jgi:hypothetical protein